MKLALAGAITEPGYRYAESKSSQALSTEDQWIH